MAPIDNTEPKARDMARARARARFKLPHLDHSGSSLIFTHGYNMETYFPVSRVGTSKIVPILNFIHGCNVGTYRLSSAIGPHIAALDKVEY